MNYAPFARILLRYFAGVLIASGWLDAWTANILASDPDLMNMIAMLIGAAIGFVSEFWYSLARRDGGAT